MNWWIDKDNTKWVSALKEVLLFRFVLHIPIMILRCPWIVNVLIFICQIITACESKIDKLWSYNIVWLQYNLSKNNTVIFSETESEQFNLAFSQLE